MNKREIKFYLRWAALGAAIGVVVVTAVKCITPAEAHVLACRDKAELTGELRRSYAAQDPAAEGVSRAGSAVQLWRDAAGDFTLIFITPDGDGCLMVVGEDWESTAPAPAMPSGTPR